MNNINIKEQKDYYPFGKEHENPNLISSTNRWGFSGKEKQTVRDLGYLDFGNRMLDTEIGRWFVIDPLAEKYYSISTYSYAANNPLRYIDPDGRKIVDAKGNVIYTQKGGWAKSATADAIRIGNAMMRTPTGRSQFAKLSGASYPVTLSISQDKQGDLGRANIQTTKDNKVIKADIIMKPLQGKNVDKMLIFR
jgi:RHS repeat-associated protein